MPNVDHFKFKNKRINNSTYVGAVIYEYLRDGDFNKDIVIDVFTNNTDIFKMDQNDYYEGTSLD